MQLERDGLVEIHPQRGTYVFTMTPEQVRQLSETRGILESAALALAMARNRMALVASWTGIVAGMRAALKHGDAARYPTLDGEFHRTSVELAQNPYLLDAFTMIAFRVQALRNRLSLEEALNRTSFADHADLLNLAGAGDAEAMDARLLRLSAGPATTTSPGSRPPSPPARRQPGAGAPDHAPKPTHVAPRLARARARGPIALPLRPAALA